MLRVLICLGLLFSTLCWAQTPALAYSAKLKVPQLDVGELRRDLELIETEAMLQKGTLLLADLKDASTGSVQVQCNSGRYTLHVAAPLGERASTMYKGIRELGFLFPHPRWQISPTHAQMRRACGKSFRWRPTLKYRGFHLHNLHPNEWVHGFFMEKGNIAEQIVRWSARNGQNVIDLSLLRLPLDSLRKQVGPPFSLAQKLEVHTGISLGLAFTQQKSYKLISVFQSFFGWDVEESIRNGIADLAQAIPLSFMVLEAGTSEFTPTSYEKTRDWLSFAADVANQKQIGLLTKVHVSTNQHHEKWGNYNYLPQHSRSNVGILAHTVMFYGLLDPKTPIYGNKDFSSMRNFILQERPKRPTWYYPETSYWIAMDLDIPLLLTDYLRTRAQDYRWLHENGVEGHLNFTTGHALGGWLMDWNVALMADSDYRFDPLTALKLLGESATVWQSHLDFQQEWFKERGLIAPLSAANLQDELSETERIHDRHTMKQLHQNPVALDTELALLEEGLKHWPSWDGVKNRELRELLRITWRRHNHAIALRKALKFKKERASYFEQAASQRQQMMATLKELHQLPTNYPDLPLFEEHTNPTSYQFGYIYPAASGYWWEREERQLREESFFPFSGNIYDVWNILF